MWERSGNDQTARFACAAGNPKNVFKNHRVHREIFINKKNFYSPNFSVFYNGKWWEVDKSAMNNRVHRDKCGNASYNQKVSLRPLWLIALFVLLCLSPSVLYAVHEAGEGGKCLDCHVRMPLDARRAGSFNEGISGTCHVCHKGHIHSHPVNVVPSMHVPRDMPLDIKGRLTCITCHSFHSGYVDAEGRKLFFLRRPKGETLCYSCHTKL